MVFSFGGSGYMVMLRFVPHQQPTNKSTQRTQSYAQSNKNLLRPVKQPTHSLLQVFGGNNKRATTWRRVPLSPPYIAPLT
jgi:hypothetical protein